MIERLHCASNEPWDKRVHFSHPLSPRLRRRRFLQLALLTPLCCGRPRSAPGKIRLGFKYQPLGSNPGPLRELLASYERNHPGVEVAAEALPNASDVAHQYFLTALEGGAGDFDVLVMDIIWTHEFARAGWIADLSFALRPEVLRREFFAAAAESGIVDGKVFAVPWYVDVGLLYYRRDLVPNAPRTYRELEQDALEARTADAHLQGYLWQGRQYEGLVCNVFESIWGHGGSTWSDGRLQLETPQVVAALVYLRSLLRGGISPAAVNSAAEEESRRAFQNGRAVFMRNWPYAFTELQRSASLVRDRVGFAALPTQDGAYGQGTLGGWNLALNARSPPRNRLAAVQLIEHLTSPQANLLLAGAYGRNPPRPTVYRDATLAEAAPQMPALLPILSAARPRPPTAYYNLVSDMLQSEFSAAIAGVRSPEAALKRAQQHIDRIVGQDA